MASNLAAKRKPAFQNASAAARKRFKTYDARTLAVQSSEAALSTSGELDVASYVEARGFEIRALESGLQRSKAALTSRAFQQVPRSLRRRTASHNVKRVPSRLRSRAKREMIEDNTPTVTARRRKPSEKMRLRLESARRLQNLNSKTKAKRAAARAKLDKDDRKLLEEAGGHDFNIAPRVPKIKKNKLSHPAPPDAKYKKRQRCKTWLPTHMFHAKRAHVATSKDPLWRFALPLSPTEKSYRPSHRARGARGAVAWDMSYIATIQLEGTEGALEVVLKAVGVDGEDAWGLKGMKWRAGTRSLRGWVFEGGDRKKPIAPVTMIRCVEPKAEDAEMVDADEASAGKTNSKKKDTKKLFVRVHPSAFLQLWNELLQVSKRQNPPVMVEDLRFEIGSIEITGPGSTEALISALSPIIGNGEASSEGSPETTWRSLLGVSNPSSLPQNALLAFSASDPRLQFPPKTLKPPFAESDMQNLAITLSSWSPDKTQTTPALFDRRARLAAMRQLPSQKAINRRRAEVGPGMYPTPKDTDPQIPLIALASRPNTQSKDNNAPGIWTVLLPWKCVLPVWYSLMYYPLSSGGNPRFGGLKEQQQLAFEGGEPWFPGDFPGTRAGWEWGLRLRDEAKREWEKRPKGRRAEFDSLNLGDGRKGEIGRGWACDWEELIRSKTTDFAPGASEIKVEEKEKQKSGTATDTNLKDEGSIAGPSPPLGMYHLTPAEARAAITNSSTTVENSSLATVKVSLSSRGTPTARARIYRLPLNDKELRDKWLALAHSKPTSFDRNDLNRHISKDNNTDARQRLAESLISPPEATQGSSEHLPLPPADDVIGFVTTGNYNLSEGQGTGIGSILLSKVVNQKRTNPKSKGKIPEKHMCIIRTAGERVGRLGYWELA
ncbi:hypothetical protein FE257_011851 [Aspergillus nanangensis]|uniref:Uncharacterized protein n=1 Tax=Aspergillus nanangensis TaxID=2582783 RepID=A0AAD4CHA9_ASPNN|nr:hypothetical protein FE257_011851 [Aspergillus nanangensis]